MSTAADGLSDTEVERLRDQMYELAHVTVNSYPRRTAGCSTVLGEVAPDDQAAIEERAAILEFEGNLHRDDAERLAAVAHFRARRR